MNQVYAKQSWRVGDAILPCTWKQGPKKYADNLLGGDYSLFGEE